MSLNINYIPSRFMGANMYIIESSQSLIVIDPSTPLSFIEKNYNKSVKYVLLTHGHFDHIDKLGDYLNKGIKFYMHKECMKKLSDPSLNLSNHTSKPLTFDLSLEDVVYVTDNYKFTIDELQFISLYTLGHTNCSVSYVLEDNIFTGDFLFSKSIGRCDFVTSNTYEMQRSIKRFKEISKNYNIYPGHGDMTTLDIEKKENYYFQ